MRTVAELGIEVELKYAAPAAALDALATAERLGDADLGPVVVNDEDDRYLDTPDRRLEAVAWACRLRTRRVDGVARTYVSLKGPAVSVEGALHRRPEVEGPATSSLDPAAWPPSAARDHLDRLRKGEPLAERLALVQRRRERAASIAGRPVALLSLDEVRVVHRGSEVGRVEHVELEEAAGADDADFDRAGAALAATPGLVPDGRAKLVRALAMIDAMPTVPR
jgi:inorganic triphosphatase YgiF